MCQKCDELNTNVNSLTEEQLMDHHFDLTIEIADLAREVSGSQMRIHMLNARLNEVEGSLEAREEAKAKKPKKSKKPKKDEKLH